MTQRMLGLIALSLLTMSATARADDAEQQQAATTAAQEWLALVDAGNYGQSWQEAAEYFRSAITQEQWEQAAGAVRKPLGAVTSRKLKSAELTTTVPGAPDGQYVIVQFDTSFEHKATAVETVVPMLDTDGKWRVSGYFIK